MPFGVNPVFFVPLAILVWLGASWGIYRILSDVWHEERSRLWYIKTLPRRLLWVALGPVSWACVVVFVVIVTLYLMTEGIWHRLGRKFQDWRKDGIERRGPRRKERFNRFVANP